MKVLIIGAKGMLGQELARVFGADKNYETIGWDFEDIDITNEAQARGKITALAPQVIINATGYNAVDKAEELLEFEIAKKVNGLAPGYLAQIAKEIKIPPRLDSTIESPAWTRTSRGWKRATPPLSKGGEEREGAIFLNYSSDYVFDGEKKEGYLEDDAPNPISKYGQSKLIGEREVAENGGRYYIVRLQKLFCRPGASSGAKKSFFETMLELAKTKEEFEMVNEELANFTYAPDLARQTKYLIENKLPFGVYHITNEGASVTWFGAAKILFELVGNSKVRLKPVGSERFPRPAKRPKYTILINTKLSPLRPWPEALKEFLRQRIL